MAFYDLTKQERADLAATMKTTILHELGASELSKTVAYFVDEDTYIRKTAYLSVGRIYFENKQLQTKIINQLDTLFEQDDFKIRQTVINAAGEIGKKEFEAIRREMQ